ncbi:MAG: hypothetical protein ACT4QE_23550 [Anaerolineales bacterium]
MTDPNLNAGRDMIAAGDIVGRDKITQNVYLQVVGSDQAGLVQQIAAIRTELQPKGQTQTGARNLEAMEKSLQEILSKVQTLEANKQVAAVDGQAARADLLLKRAILFKSDAEQMMLDAVRKNAARQQLPPGQRVEIDLGNYLAGFDEGAYEAKLHEAQRQLQEANVLDPGNIETMLHLASVLGQLTTDPTERERLLYQVQSLLHFPKNDTERFQLAQATYLLAISREPNHPDMLRRARDMFAQLGQTGWVEQCDSILRSLGSGYGTGPGGAPPAPAFQPGRWTIQIGDMVRSVMWLDFYPNGVVQGMQRAGFVQAQLNGQWGFNPANNWLQVNGFINGFQPFMLSLFFQGLDPQGNLVAQGGDGLTYWFTRTG